MRLGTDTAHGITRLTGIICALGEPNATNKGGEVRRILFVRNAVTENLVGWRSMLCFLVGPASPASVPLLESDSFLS